MLAIKSMQGLGSEPLPASGIKKKKKRKKRKCKLPMSGMKEGISLCLTDVKRIIIEYYEQLYVYKLDKLNRMDKFSQKISNYQNLPMMR